MNWRSRPIKDYFQTSLGKFECLLNSIGFVYRFRLIKNPVHLNFGGGIYILPPCLFRIRTPNTLVTKYLIIRYGPYGVTQAIIDSSSSVS